MTENTIQSHNSIAQNTIDLPQTNTIRDSSLIDVDIKFYLSQNIHRKKIRLNSFSSLQDHVRQFILEKGIKADFPQIQMKYIDSSNEKINLDDQEAFDLAISDFKQLEIGEIRTLKVIASLKSTLSSFNSSNTQNNTNLSNSDSNQLCSTEASTNHQITSTFLKSSENKNINDPNYSMFLLWKQFYLQQNNQFKHLSKSLSTRDSPNNQKVDEKLVQQEYQFKSLPSQMSVPNRQSDKLDQQDLAFQIEKQQSQYGFQEQNTPVEVQKIIEDNSSNQVANADDLVTQAGKSSTQSVQTTKEDKEQPQELSSTNQQNLVYFQNIQQPFENDTNDDLFMEKFQVGQSIVRDRAQVAPISRDLGYFQQNQRYLLQLRNDAQSEECILQILGQIEKCQFCQKGLICEFKNKQKMISSIVDKKITEALFALRPVIQKSIETIKNQSFSGMVNDINQQKTKQKEYFFNDCLDNQQISSSSSFEVEGQQIQTNQNEIENKNINNISNDSTTHAADKAETISKTDAIQEISGRLDRSDEIFFQQNNQILKEILQTDNKLESNQGTENQQYYQLSTPGQDQNLSQKPELVTEKIEKPPAVIPPETVSSSLLNRFGFLTHLTNKQSLVKKDDQNILTKSLHNVSNNAQPIQNLQTELSQSLGKEKISKEGFFLVDFEELEEEQQLDENDAKFLEFAKLATQANKQQQQQQFSSSNNSILSNHLAMKTKLKNITEDVIEEEESKEEVKGKTKSAHHDSVWCLRRDKSSNEVQYNAEFIKKEIIVEFQIKEPSKDILVDLKNTGKKHWHKGSVKLRCLKGVFENNEVNLPETNVGIGQIIAVNLQLHTQQLKLNNYITQWRLFLINKRGSDLQFFGPTLQIILIGQNSELACKLPISESFWEKINTKLIQMTDTDELSKQKITEFIMKKQKFYAKYDPSKLDDLTCQIVNEFLDS